MAAKRASLKVLQAVEEVDEFLVSFQGLEDPRQRAKVLYPLDEVLLLVLFAVLAGCESWVEIARFGECQIAFLRRFRPFRDGTPSHDQLGDIFAVLDPDQFQRCFVEWVTRISKIGADIVAIDGKTLRRSYQEKGAKAPIHMLSAWSCGHQLVLGQKQVPGKSNEITAIPELLDAIAIKSATVTIDAMGCQREIAAKIIDKGADYVLALKGNQGTLRDDVELLFNEQKHKGFKDIAVNRDIAPVEKSHGRLETRIVTATADIDWLVKTHCWPGLRTVVMVESRRELADRCEREYRYYVSSRPPDAKRLGEAVRSHWGIENGLHWVMDMVFRDDECRIRKGHAAANFSTIKHMASNCLRRAPGKDSMRVKRKVASWDPDYLAALVMGR